MDPYTALYLKALGVTVAVEVPLVTWLASRVGTRAGWRVVGVALGANLLTHGVLWTVFDRMPGSYPARVAALEAGVVGVEAAIFAGFDLFSRRRALAVALGVNAVTTAIGLLWL